MVKEVKLKPVTKKDFLGALRGGKFKQARSALYDPTAKGYCCLGVAARLAGVPWQRLSEHNTSYLYSGNLSNIEGVSNEDMKGLVTGLEIEGIQATLAQKNDNGVPFTKIADYLEARYKGVFE